MRKQIPNLITCMNVISGTLAIFLAMYGLLTAAAILILVGMVFDFFDGMTARLLHVKSEIGKELDSLAENYREVISCILPPGRWGSRLQLSCRS